MMDAALEFLLDEFGRRWFRTAEAHRLDLVVGFFEQAYALGLTSDESAVDGKKEIDSEVAAS
jgi:hypothetical protein